MMEYLKQTETILINNSLKRRTERVFLFFRMDLLIFQTIVLLIIEINNIRKSLYILINKHHLQTDFLQRIKKRKCKMKSNYYKLTVQNDIWNINKRYTNLELIGRGAYGSVVSASDQIKQREVAIKKVCVNEDSSHYRIKAWLLLLLFCDAMVVLLF